MEIQGKQDLALTVVNILRGESLALGTLFSNCNPCRGLTVVQLLLVNYGEKQGHREGAGGRFPEPQP